MIYIYEKLEKENKINDDMGSYITLEHGMLYFNGHSILDNNFMSLFTRMLKDPNKILKIYS